MSEKKRYWNRLLQCWVSDAYEPTEGFLLTTKKVYLKLVIWWQRLSGDTQYPLSSGMGSICGMNNFHQN